MRLRAALLATLLHLPPLVAPMPTAARTRPPVWGDTLPATVDPHAAFEGPAILVQLDATTLVPPGWKARAHPTGAIILDAATPA